MMKALINSPDLAISSVSKYEGTFMLRWVKAKAQRPLFFGFEILFQTFTIRVSEEKEEEEEVFSKSVTKPKFF